jgi:hypothetical protein
MQTRGLRESAERRGWKVAGEYVDVGSAVQRKSVPSSTA